jgi:hypothetical protein
MEIVSVADICKKTGGSGVTRGKRRMRQQKKSVVRKRKEMGVHGQCKKRRRCSWIKVTECDELHDWMMIEMASQGS